MGRSCDAGICRQDATRIATFSAERSEMKTKAACSLLHQLDVGREIITAGWVPSWRLLPGAMEADKAADKKGPTP